MSKCRGTNAFLGTVVEPSSARRRLIKNRSKVKKSKLDVVVALPGVAYYPIDQKPDVKFNLIGAVFVQKTKD